MMKRVLSRIPNVVLLLLLLLGITLGSGCGGPPVLTIAFTTSPQVLDAGIVSGVMTIHILDAKGMPYSPETDTVITLTSTSSTTKFLTSSTGNWYVTSVTMPKGSTSVSFYYKDTTAGSPTIRAEAPSQGWTAATQKQTVNAAALDHFSFATIGNQTENIAFSVNITAQDVYGNTVTSYTDTNALTDTTGTINPTVTGTFTGGIWMGNITIASVQSGVTITTSGGGKSGVSNAFDIVASTSASAKLAFTTAPQTIAAGNVSGIITLQTQDASSNPYNVTANTTINLMSSSASGTFYSDAAGLKPITLVTITAGANSASFYYKDTPAGSPTITVAEAPSQGWTAANQTQTVNAAALDHFSFAIISNQTENVAFSVNITAQDVYGNTVTSYTNSNTLTNTTGTISPTTTGAFAGGIWMGNITIASVQSGVTITTSGGSKSGVSNAFDIVSGAVTSAKLAFTTAPQTIAAGNVSGIITFQTQDASSNPYNVTADTTINLTSSSASGTFYSDAAGLNPISLVTINAGASSASFYYKDTTAGSPTITVAESPSQGWTAAAQVESVAGVIAKLAFTTTPQTITAGNVSGIITLQTQDTSSNPYNVTANTIINLTSSSANGTFYSDAAGLNPINRVTINAGGNSASFYYKDTKAGSPTITAAESPSQGWTAATQYETINRAAPPAGTGISLLLVIIIGAGCIILGLLIGYLIYLRKKSPATQKESVKEIQPRPISTMAERQAEVAEAAEQEQVPEVTQKTAEVAEAAEQEQVPEVAQKTAQMADATRKDPTSDLLLEIETNHRIATTRAKDSLIAFQTQVWDSKRDEVSLSAIVKDELTKAYSSISLANRIVSLATDMGRRSPTMDDNYATLCKGIADRLDKVRQLIEQS